MDAPEDFCSVAEPYPPKLFHVSSPSNSSLRVKLDYGYEPSVGQCLNFTLTTDPSSARKSVPCDTSETDLAGLHGNAEYRVSVVTVAKHLGWSTFSTETTVTAWTRTSRKNLLAVFLVVYLAPATGPRSRGSCTGSRLSIIISWHLNLPVNLTLNLLELYLNPIVNPI